MQEALRLEAIKRCYYNNNSPLLILDHVDFTFFRGQMTALVAPSGSGKSTLLHIAGLLEHPDDGEVFIENQPSAYLSNGDRTRIRRDKIGFIYQFHHLLSEFTAIENVMMPLLIKGHCKKYARNYAASLLKTLLLEERLYNRPAELSGGEQQRVAIARALANAPSILLADEPTGNLDPETSELVFSLLMDLVKEKNICALIATHNYKLAEKMDRSITLSEGKLQDFTL